MVDLVAATAGLVMTLASLRIDASSVVFIGRGHNITRTHQRANALTLALGFTTGVVLIATASRIPNLFGGLAFRDLVIASCIGVLGLLRANAMAVARAIGRAIAAAGVDLGARMAQTALLLGLTWVGALTERRATYALLITAVGSWVVAEVVALRDTSGPGDSSRRPSLRDFLAYGVRGHFGSLSQYVNYRADVWVVNYYWGAAEVGLYTVAVSIAELLLHLPRAAAFVLFPKLAVGHPRKRVSDAQRITRKLWVLVGAGVVGISLAIPAIPWAFGPQFGGAVGPALLLLPGIAFLGVGWILTSFFDASGKPEHTSLSALCTVAATIGFDLLLVPRYGALGAAIASSLSYATFLAFAMVLFVRDTQAPLLAFIPRRADLDGTYHGVAASASGIWLWVTRPLMIARLLVRLRKTGRIKGTLSQRIVR